MIRLYELLMVLGQGEVWEQVVWGRVEGVVAMGALAVADVRGEGGGCLPDVQLS